MIVLIIALLISYLLGSFPSAYVLGKTRRGVDIRRFGSGNVGATNAFRMLGRKLGIAVLLVDLFKGLIVVLLVGGCAYRILQNSNSFLVAPLSNITINESILKIILGFTVIAGHIWSVFLKFEGGKGVATSLGVCLGLCPKVALIVLLILVWVVVRTRYISLGSIIGFLSLPLLLFVLRQPKELFIFGVTIAALIAWTHKPNIQRLLIGEEDKFRGMRRAR